MIRFIYLVIFICITSPALPRAQAPIDSLIKENIKGKKLRGAKKRLDSLLDKRDSSGRKKTDTVYIQRMPTRFRIRLMLNASGSNIIAKGLNEGVSFKADLSAKNKYTVSIGASYRGLSAALAINPAHLSGRNKDYEFNVNAYSNRLGADLIFRSTKTFKGKVMSEDNESVIPEGAVRQKHLNANIYYVFNSRRFSYPAAFTQSWMQKRSCGSFMVGSSLTMGNIDVDNDNALWDKALSLKFINIGIGAGYAYNLVLRKGWLIHLSSLPEIVVFSRCTMKEDGNKEETPYRFPNVIAVGRIAVVRHFDKYYAGLSAVVNTSTIGDADKLLFQNVGWRARVFIGIKI